MKLLCNRELQARMQASLEIQAYVYCAQAKENLCDIRKTYSAGRCCAAHGNYLRLTFLKLN